MAQRHERNRHQHDHVVEQRHDQSRRPSQTGQALPAGRRHQRHDRRGILEHGFLAKRLPQLGWCLAAIITSLVITSCTTAINGTPRPAGVSGQQPASEPPKAPRPADRNPQAVSVALRQLDACKVFNLDTAKAAGNPTASLLPTGPHSCMLTPTANYTPATHGIEVTVGDGANQLFRDLGTPITLQGAKAYEYRDYSTTKRCELLIPVSFTRAITVHYDAFDDTDTCQVLRPVAEAAIAKLQNPNTLTVNPTTRPGAAWDGCLLLAHLLTDQAPHYTYQPAGVQDPFSGCHTSKKTDKDSTPHLSSTPKLEVAYDQTPTNPKQTRQIGGKTAEVRTYTNSCALTWNQADSGTGNQWFAALVVTLTADTCDTAAQLAEKAVTLYDQTPDDAATTPQRPLLYRPDDNDNPGPGACADFGTLGASPDCEPYHEVSIPNGIDTIMQAAATNRNVQCAVFHDAVTTLFGPSFNALTWGENCFFVEPTHTLELRVNVDNENPPNDYGTNPNLWTDRQQTTIAGKPAITFWDTHKKDYDIYLSPYNDLTRNGNLHIHIEAKQGRGNGAHKNRLDPTKAETAKQVIEQVTQKYFAQ